MVCCCGCLETPQQCKRRPRREARPARTGQRFLVSSQRLSYYYLLLVADHDGTKIERIVVVSHRLKIGFHGQARLLPRSTSTTMGKKKTTSSKLDYLSKYVSGKKKKLIEEEEPPEEDGPVIVDPSEMRGAAGFNVNQGPTSERRKSRKKDHRRRSESPSARRRRYDSEDEQPSRSLGEKRSRRYDSDDDEPTVKRHDSDEEEQPVNHRRPRKRYDSEDEEQPRRKRYDSEDDEQQPRRKRYDSEDEQQPRRKRSDSEDSSRERMSSGHVAGLQSAGDFSKQEALLQHEKRQRTKEMVEQHGMGDTVYRNGEGQKGVVVQENRRQLTEAEATLLKTGRVQRERQEAAQRELESMQHSSLARYADDAALEAQRKAMLRADDPMMRSSQSQRGGARPIYKGPPAKPNRYGIRPGYRWDGVDRGNGWEDRLLAQKYSKQHERERAYRWSTADL